MNAGIAPLTEFFESNFTRNEARKLLEPCRVFFDYIEKDHFPLLPSDQLPATGIHLLRKLAGAKKIVWLSYRDIEDGRYSQLPKPNEDEDLWQTIANSDMFSMPGGDPNAPSAISDAEEVTKIDNALGELFERQFPLLEKIATWLDPLEPGHLHGLDLGSVCIWVMYEYLVAAFERHQAQHEIRSLLTLCAHSIPLYMTRKKHLYVLTA